MSKQEKAEIICEKCNSEITIKNLVTITLGNYPQGSHSHVEVCLLCTDKILDYIKNIFMQGEIKMKKGIIYKITIELQDTEYPRSFAPIEKEIHKECVMFNCMKVINGAITHLTSGFEFVESESEMIEDTYKSTIKVSFLDYEEADDIGIADLKAVIRRQLGIYTDTNIQKIEVEAVEVNRRTDIEDF